jgi:energy-coupling factor transporter ATP-binding protein EcfA2
MNTYDHYFPFAKLGLSSNPFRRLTDEEWADIAVIPAPIETAFNAGDNLLILGKRGRGKSTILRHLSRRIAWQGKRTVYERIPESRWQYQTHIQGLDAFALDEAQRLLLWKWIPLLNCMRNGMRLIIGSHRNDAWLFRLAGIPVTVFRLEELYTRQHLATVLQCRLDYFTTDGEPLVNFAPSAFDYLWQQYGDNLRAIEAHLYDVFQQLDQPTTITEDHLSNGRRF